MYPGLTQMAEKYSAILKVNQARPEWEKIVSDEGLRKFAKLLRFYHDAVADYSPDPDLEWATGAKGVKPGEIICHGDFGPWNIVWRNDEPVGIIDWELVHPALPEEDILYGLHYLRRFGMMKRPSSGTIFQKFLTDTIELKFFLMPMARILCQKLRPKSQTCQRTVGRYEGYLARRGVQPQVDWVAHGES